MVGGIICCVLQFVFLGLGWLLWWYNLSGGIVFLKGGWHNLFDGVIYGKGTEFSFSRAIIFSFPS